MLYLGEVVSNNQFSENFIYILAAFAVFIFLFLLMVVYYKIRIAKLEKYADFLKNQEDEKVNIGDIAAKIKEDIKSEVRKTSNFESAQEDDAVISYQELLKKEQGVKPQPKPFDYSQYRASKTEALEKTNSYQMVDESSSFNKENQPVATLVKEKEEEKRTDNTEFLNRLVDLRSNLK